MTSEKDESTSALSVSPPLGGRTLGIQNGPPSLVREPRRNYNQACRIVGTFFIFFITWGVASSFSAYQAFYQQDLLADRTPSSISWIGTTQVSLLGFTGIVSGALYDRGYIRTLLVVGGVMVVFGFMMLSLAKEYYQIILTQGVCIGLGEFMFADV